MPNLAKKFVIRDNLSTLDRATLFAAEFVATGILVFLGCMGCMNRIAPNGSIPHEQVSWTFGLAVMVAIQCFGHISGAHLNPVVTVAAAILGNTPLVQVPLYILGQITGAIAAYGLLKVATPSMYLYGEMAANATKSTVGVCSPELKYGISPVNGLLVEFVITFILIVFCCGVWDHRNNAKQDSASIRFGFAVAVLAMAAGPYTGAHMNPARSFAPALWNSDWQDHWVYWVGPTAAAIVGALLYRFVFARPPAPQRQEILPEGVPLNDKI